MKLGFTRFLNVYDGIWHFRCLWVLKILLNPVLPRRMPHAHSALIPYEEVRSKVELMVKLQIVHNN